MNAQPHILFNDARDFDAIGASYEPGTLPLSVANIEVGTHTSVCHHSDKHHLVLARKSKGVLNVEVDGEKETFKTHNDMLTFLPAGTRQLFDFDGQTENTILFFDPAFMNRLGLEWSPDDAVKYLGIALHFTHARIAHLVKEIDRNIRAHEPGSQIMAEAAALHLGSEIFKHFVGKNKGGGKAELSDKDLNRITEYLQAHLDSNIGLAQMADLVGMDVFSFSRAFKAATGSTPGRTLIQMRIERACRLMTEKDLTLADVAYICGFSSQAHFTTTFSKHMGLTPGKYKREAAK